MALYDSTKIKNTDNITNSSITNVLQSLTSGCKVLNNNTQVVSGTNRTFNNISNSTITARYLQEIQSKLNASCLQTSQVQGQLQSKVSAEMDKQIKSKTTGIAGLVNKTDMQQITNLKNDVVNNIDVKSITECLAKVTSDQKIMNDTLNMSNISGSNVNADISQKIVSEVVTQCIQNNANLQDATVALDNKLTTVLGVEKKGLDINELFKDFTGMLSSPIFIIVAIVGVLLMHD